MGTNVNLDAALKLIAENANFLNSAGDSFKEGETLQKVLFVNNGSNVYDSFIVQDESGDTYKISASELENILTDEQFDALVNAGSGNEINQNAQENVNAIDVSLKTDAVQPTETVADPANVENAAAVQATTAATSSAEIQKEIEALQLQRDANLESMGILKEQIEDLKEKIEQSIADALEEMEEIEEEQKKEAEEVVAQELKKFEESNGEMTQEQFSANVQEALGKINPSMATALTHIMSADNNMALMNNLLGQLSQKITIDGQLADEIGTKELAYQEALAAEKAAEEAAEKAAEEAASKSSSCDPIGANFGESLGFDLDGDNSAGQIQIDFFYDADGDGKINSLDDFVGAKSDAAGGDGWDEMAAFDAAGNGDGIISSDELEAQNVKVMVTEVDSDGTKSQRAMSIDEFTEQVGKGDLEISAKKHDEVNTGVVGPFGFDDNANNQLLGTFDIGFTDDQSVDTIGYQTLDDQSWLVENYSENMDLASLQEQGVDVSGVDAAAQAQELGDVAIYEQFMQQYMEVELPKLEAEINNAYAQIGFSQGAIEIYKDMAEANAELEGQRIAEDIAAKEAEALEEENGETEEVPVGEGNNTTGETEVDPDELKDKEEV